MPVSTTKRWISSRWPVLGRFIPVSSVRQLWVYSRLATRNLRHSDSWHHALSIHIVPKSYSTNSHSKVRKMRRQGLLEIAGIRKMYILAAIMKHRFRTSARRWPCHQSLSLLQSHIGGYSLGEVWERPPHSYSQNRGNEPVTATLFRKRQVFMLKVFWFPMKYSKSPQNILPLYLL